MMVIRRLRYVNVWWCLYIVNRTDLQLGLDRVLESVPNPGSHEKQQEEDNNQEDRELRSV